MAILISIIIKSKKSIIDMYYKFWYVFVSIWLMF